MKRLALVTVATFAMLTTTAAMAQPPGGRGPGEGNRDGGLERMMSFDENDDGKLSKDEVPERLHGLFARADKNEDGQLTRDEIAADFGGREGERRERGGEGRGGEGRGRGGEGRGGEGRGGEGRGRGGDGRGGREGGDRGMEGGRGPGRGPGGMPPNPIFEALDADGNGELSADEINNATAALKKLDRNKNGKLDMAELGPPPRGRDGGGFEGGREGGRDGGREGGRPPGGDPAQRVAFMLDRHDTNDDGKISRDEAPEQMRQGFQFVDQNDDGELDKSELEAMARRMAERGGQGGGGRGGFGRPPGEGGGGRGGSGRPPGEGGGGEGRKRPPIEE